MFGAANGLLKDVSNLTQIIFNSFLITGSKTLFRTRRGNDEKHRSRSGSLKDDKNCPRATW